MTKTWEAIIGLEVHAQLRTASKLFATAATDFGADANSQVTPVCLGMPGALPVLNREAIRLAVRAGLAVGCDITERSVFARKSYFYPDLPKGYQISQFARPLCVGGGIEVPGDEPVFARLVRIHVEEDAGKSMHGEGSGRTSDIDLNRAGVPLVEIVGEPDLRSAEQAVRYLRELRAILRYIGVCDGNMEQGSFRCDANVSIRPAGSPPLGTRCEIKNMNSFRAVREAINYEIGRQIRMVEAGDAVQQQTRLWDADRGRTEKMRGKEEAHDYRYFPDPDLLPVWVSTDAIEAERGALPELPAARRQRLLLRGVTADAAAALCEERERVDAFEAALGEDRSAESCASLATFVLSRAVGALNQSDRTWDDVCAAMAELAATHDAWRGSKLSNKMLAEVLTTAFGADAPLARALADARSAAGSVVSDADALRPIIEGILAQHEAKVAEYRGGKHKLYGFFMGRVMRALKGKADARAVQRLLKSALDG